MIIYRICNTIYNEDLSGNGAKLFGGRWNNRGTTMLYATEFISLSLLEMLVHTRFKDFSIPLSLLYISVPEPEEIVEVKVSRIKKDWREDAAYTRFMGDRFIEAGKSLLMKVPSAVVEEEHNYLVNPQHPDFKKMRIANSRDFETDNRLFSI